MSTRPRRILSIIGIGILLLLHNDWLLSPVGGPLLFDPHSAVLGRLPADMAYRLAWVALSCAGFYAVMRCTWRDKA